MARSPKRPQARDTTPDGSGSATASPSSFSPGGDDRHRVASRAYELYEERGGGHGNDMEDWLTAEREVSDGDSQAAENLRDTND
jgi:hypothetical protein